MSERPTNLYWTELRIFLEDGEGEIIQKGGTGTGDHPSNGSTRRSTPRD
jgi:hypothetical protein